MKRCKTKAFRLFNDHACSIGNIDTDFDNACGDKYLYFSEPEIFKDTVLCFFIDA